MARPIKKKRWPIILQTAIALIILGLAGFYLSRHPEVFSRLRDLSPRLILLLLLANLAMHWSNGIVYLYACRPFGVELKFREWFGLAVLNNFASLFLPFAAAVGIRAVYLKRKHGFLYSHFISLMAGYHAVLFVAIGALLLVSLGFVRVSSETARIFLWLPAIFVAAGSIALLFPLPRFLRRGRLGLVAEGWEVLRRNRPAVVGIAFSVVALQIFNALQLLWGFQAIGRSLPFWNLVFIAAWVTLVHVVKITPGNLGVMEGFIAGFATLSGVPLQEGLLVAGLVRAFNVISAVILAPLFATLLGIHLTAPAANSEPAGEENL
jgi:uncharacterized membrane protein YbhN (UPF0104 family)